MFLLPKTDTNSVFSLFVRFSVVVHLDDCSLLNEEIVLTKEKVRVVEVIAFVLEVISVMPDELFRKVVPNKLVTRELNDCVVPVWFVVPAAVDSLGLPPEFEVEKKQVFSKANSLAEVQTIMALTHTKDRKGFRRAGQQDRQRSQGAIVDKGR